MARGHLCYEMGKACLKEEAELRERESKIHYDITFGATGFSYA